MSSYVFKLASLLTVFFSLLTPLRATEHELEADSPIPSQRPVPLQEDLLIQAGNKFMNFLTLIGYGKTPITEEGLLDLFTSSCIKIVNMQTICHSPAEHHEQLLHVRATLGKWSLEPLRVYPSVQTNTCTVHFLWCGNNGRPDDAPPHVVMAVLDIDVRGA